ncbi:MAG: hypothetical protein IPG48_06625 [Saprospiraceae bacterium]|nr:hypothetical protein [Saprospiraceae bacterium]
MKCFGFIACSKDEDASQSVDLASLKGTWNLVSLSCTDGTSTIEILGQNRQLNSDHQAHFWTTTCKYTHHNHNNTAIHAELDGYVIIYS